MSEFENYVNYAGSKTDSILHCSFLLFENYVNYAGSKTTMYGFDSMFCLRTM